MLDQRVGCLGAFEAGKQALRHQKNMVFCDSVTLLSGACGYLAVQTKILTYLGPPLLLVALPLCCARCPTQEFKRGKAWSIARPPVGARPW